MKRYFPPIQIMLLFAVIVTTVLLSCGTEPLAPNGTDDPPPPPPTHTPTLGWQIQAIRADLDDFCGSSSDDVYALGEFGSISHWDGNKWSPIRVFPSPPLYALWIAPDSQIFAGGWWQEICQFDGEEWSSYHVPMDDYIFDIWGTSSSDIYAVGIGRPIHYDGTTWTRMEDSHIYQAWLVWGLSDTSVYVCDFQGHVDHYDGSTWTLMDLPDNKSATSIWGTAPNDLYAGCGEGIIAHYDGTSWTRMGYIADDPIIALGGSSSSDVYAMTNTQSVYHYDGTTWSLISQCGGCGARAGWISKDGVVFAGKSQAASIFGGTHWSQYPLQLTRFAVSDIWGASDTDVFAVSEEGAIYHYDGTQWELQLHLNQGMYSVWGSGNNLAFVAGANGIVFQRLDGVWSQSACPTSKNLHDLWGSSDTSVYAVGDSGTILQWTGSANAMTGCWEKMQCPVGDSLYSIWGSSETDIYAVGVGIILHYDGSTWSEVESVPAVGYKAVWGSSDHDVYARGPGVILHFDGLEWQAHSLSSEYDWFLNAALWGTSESSVYSPASGGVILHFDGAEWSTLEDAPFGGFAAIWGTSDTSFFAVGEDGAIFHYGWH